MCESCGCNITPGNEHLVRDDKQAITVLQSLMSENDQQAMHNRQHFDQHGVLAINLMSSPGAGKTALLEASIDALRDDLRIAVIEGDLETENDAERIRAKGIQAIQITTGTACHLDAHMVHDALHQLKLADLDVVFIENVGNLVCPASFDLGQHRNITLLSVPEGDDKPAKYPVMFRAADLMLLSKADLLPVLDDFDCQRAEDYLRKLASDARVMTVSAKTGQGMESWLAWLDNEITAHRIRVENGESLRPAIQPEGAQFHKMNPSPAQGHSLLRR